jgi:hypothetical protein
VHGPYAAIEHNKRIDDNAQADYEQLSYLTWADVILSDDTRFPRDCFDAVCRPCRRHPSGADTIVIELC